MPTFIVPENMKDLSLKDFLRHSEGISLTLWRKIKRDNIVMINHKPVKPSLALVSSGDIIQYEIYQESSIVPVKMPLDICYEDEYLLVVNKPAGQLVHPTTKEHYTTLANGILYHYQEQGLPLTYHPVHRLDKNTSGLVLIAKMPHIQHLFSFSEEKKSLNRIYQAIVQGTPNPETGIIDAPIGRKAGSIIERMVIESGQPARTYYQTLKIFQNAALVELKLATGRTHQIRVHLSHIGHPIWGDDLYGGSTDFINRQALHAKQLSFNHPITKEKITLNCQLPGDIQKIINILN